jgi:hypothetical protein
MLPTEQQIRQAAHARWVQGGCLDGFALDDWIGAEEDLVLARPPFRTIAHALPEFIGNKSLIAYDECDGCNEFFSETIEDSLAKMLFPLRTLLLIGGKTGIPTQKANEGGFRMSTTRTTTDSPSRTSPPTGSWRRIWQTAPCLRIWEPSHACRCGCSSA